MTFRTLFVIASRVWKGRRYRTRYYRHCHDGAIVLGSKREATRFPPDVAARVCDQLATMSPLAAFFAFDDRIRPPRGATNFRPAAPSQFVIPSLDELAP